MFFRFASGLILVVLISMAGIQIERSTLQTRRVVSRQYYQTDLLLELHAQLRLQTQRRTALSQISHDLQPSRSPVRRAVRETQAAEQEQTSAPSARAASRLPLLKFQQPFNPEGID